MKRASTTATSGERLQKILSQAGVSSRRAAEEMIRSGRVTVNGRTTTELGTRANPWTDRIAVDGKPLRPSAPPVYLLLNKPVGVVTTLDDPQGRPTVRDLLKGMRARVFPVGRLDYHSAGLLLLTNDGELALRLTHPRYGIRKTYQVKVKGDPQPSQLATLAGGVRLADGTTNPADVHVLRQRDHKTWLSITLAEGKNRQVRRMCEAVGLPVEKLVRVAFGALKLGALPPGAWRHLDPSEVDQLRRPAPPPRPARPPRGRQRPHSLRRPEEAEGGERQPRPGAVRAGRERPTRGGGERRAERASGGQGERKRPLRGTKSTARPPRAGFGAGPPRRHRDGPPSSAAGRSLPPRRGDDQPRERSSSPRSPSARPGGGRPGGGRRRSR